MKRSRDHCFKPSPLALKSSCIVLTDFHARSKFEYASQPANRSASSRDRDVTTRVVMIIRSNTSRTADNVGAGSPLKIDRGLNRLWNKGGVQYAPPIR